MLYLYMVEITKTYTPEEFFEKFDLEVVAYFEKTEDLIEELFRKAKAIEVTIPIPVEELGINEDKIEDVSEKVYDTFVELLQKYNLNYFIIYASPFGKERDPINTIKLDISTIDIVYYYVKDTDYIIKIHGLSHVIVMPEDKSKPQKILGRSVLSIYKPYGYVENIKDVQKYIKENDRINALFEKFKEYLAIYSL